MKAKEVEWEVLPPEEETRRNSVDALFKWLALIMDQFLRVPGTKLRFGLDPIIGLIPGLGDTASALISAVSLVYAARCGVPRIMLGRMALNILLNEVIGIIPGIGDAFSFWFKSNVRNYELLQQHLATPGRARKGDWAFVAIVLGALLLIAFLGILVSLLLLQGLIRLLSPS